MIAFIKPLFPKNETKIRHLVGMIWVTNITKPCYRLLEHWAWVTGPSQKVRGGVGSGYSVITNWMMAPRTQACSLSILPSWPLDAAKGWVFWLLWLPVKIGPACLLTHTPRERKRELGPQSLTWSWLVGDHEIQLSSFQEFCKLAVKHSCY